MTFSTDEQGPTVVGDPPGDALATRRHFLKQSGVVAATGLGTGAAAAALPGTSVAASRRRGKGHEPSSPESLRRPLRRRSSSAHRLCLDVERSAALA